MYVEISFLNMRFTVHPIFLLLILQLCFSCTGKGNGAKEYLSDADRAYKSGNYPLAKLKIDSIKILYPESFDEIKAGFELMQEVRMAENRRNIVFCDSMLHVNYALLNEMLTKFDFVRDSRYQEFGEYYPKVYPHHSSLQRNGLRSGVREKGVLFIESILSDSSIKHNHIRVTSRDGSFAETLPVTSDGLNYRFNTLDRGYEIVRYSGKDENGVAQFIYTFQDDPVTVQFIGKRTITVPLSEVSRKGIAQSFELSSLLLNIEQLKMEKEKSEVLIRYLESRSDRR
ncbi:MAG: hypothetical protein PHS71_07625 [Proteiniphilum sp.]|nr:hypothetical protein [Proteiniphilum sp.]MDD4799475.1 hypothetical protein [Proteiniphilum sp.]